jgi:hypothetical protein
MSTGIIRRAAFIGLCGVMAHSVLAQELSDATYPK